MSDTIPRRTRIPINVIAVLGLGVLVAAAIGSVLFLGLSVARKNTIELMSEKAETSIEVIIAQIDRHLEPVEDQARWIAEAISQDRVSTNGGEQLKIFLAGALSATPQVSAVGFVRPDGTMTAYFRDEKRATDMSWPEGEQFRILLEKTRTLAKSTWRNPIWSDRLKQMIVILQTPVRKNGRFVGVLNLTVPITGLSRFLADKASSNFVPFIIYDKTRLIAHPTLTNWLPEDFIKAAIPNFENLGDTVLEHIWDSPSGRINMLRSFRGERLGETKANIVDVGDRQYIFIHKNITHFGQKPWTVGLYMDSRTIDKQINRLSNTFIVGAVFLVITLTLAVFGGRWVSGPVRRIALAADRVQKGDLEDVPILEPSRILELDMAAKSFNEMVIGLRERLLIRQALGRYMPEKVADSLLRDGGTIETVDTEATVLFSDIEKFTEMTENLGPEGIVSLLNEYFSEMVEILERHGGVVTQFQGDAILATFNVPITDPNHASNALQAAVEMQRAGARQTFGGHKVGTRIGINTGTVIAGAVGARGRLSYTVHGDAVNLAARVEALNKEYKTRILTTQSTAEKTSGFALKRVGETSIRGQSGRVLLYRLEAEE